MIDQLVTSGTVVASVAAIALTLARGTAGDPGQHERPLEEATRLPAAAHGVNEDDNLAWGITSLTSCIPLISSVVRLDLLQSKDRCHPRTPRQAWVLPAMSYPELASMYYSYCALYSVPLLRSGFDFDGYTVLMLVLCVAHVQVPSPSIIHSPLPLSHVLLLLLRRPSASRTQSPQPCEASWVRG